MAEKYSQLDAIIAILEEKGPYKLWDATELIKERGWLSSNCKTLKNSLSAAITRHLKAKKGDSLIVPCGDGIYALKKHVRDGMVAFNGKEIAVTERSYVDEGGPSKGGRARSTGGAESGKGAARGAAGVSRSQASKRKRKDDEYDSGGEDFSDEGPLDSDDEDFANLIGSASPPPPPTPTPPVPRRAAAAAPTAPTQPEVPIRMAPEPDPLAADTSFFQSALGIESVGESLIPKKGKPAAPKPNSQGPPSSFRAAPPPPHHRDSLPPSRSRLPLPPPPSTSALPRGDDRGPRVSGFSDQPPQQQQQRSPPPPPPLRAPLPPPPKISSQGGLPVIPPLPGIPPSTLPHISPVPQAPSPSTTAALPRREDANATRSSQPPPSQPPAIPRLPPPPPPLPPPRSVGNNGNSSSGSNGGNGAPPERKKRKFTSRWDSSDDEGDYRAGEHVIMVDDKKAEEETRLLEEFLRKENRVIQEVPGDGHCLFHAWLEQLKRLSVPFPSRDHVARLRETVANELTSPEHAQLYKEKIENYLVTEWKEIRPDHASGRLTERQRTSNSARVQQAEDNKFEYLISAIRTTKEGDHLDVFSLSRFFRVPVLVYEVQELPAGPRVVCYSVGQEGLTNEPARLTFHKYLFGGRPHFNSVVDLK